ncbi:MAG: type III-B CRISPR module-associated protein Cmr5 [Thermodesulfobacteriota bacterium]
MMRTLGQKRAAFALKEVLQNRCSKPKEFKTFCAGAPAVILQNGFGQALAFWYSKVKDNHTDKHQVLLDIIMKWLCLKDGDVRNAFIDPCQTTKEMVLALSGMNQQKYLTAQGETLALLEWIKRYANALLKGD